MPDPKPVPAVPKTRVALTTPPFPPKYPDPLVQNDKLKAALTKAIDAGPGASWRVGIAIASLENPGAHPMAHFKGDREFFGASMIKIAALYGLMELRNTLRAIAKELGTNTSKTELLKDAARYMNPLILKKVDDLPALKGIKSSEVRKAQALPLYSEAFKVDGPTGGPFTVNFADKYELKTVTQLPGVDPVGSEIENMITVSNNGSASRCTHACGYGYLNGALASAGLFEPGTGKGLWLAGDYTGAYTYYRIDSDNDQGVAQASTALALVRLFALLQDGTLFGKNADGKNDMLKVLSNAAKYPEVFINRDWPIDFDVIHNKLGFANLKQENDRGANVYSECSILQHTSGKRFAVAWLNLLPDFNTADRAKSAYNPVAKVVNETINEYLKP